MSLFDLTEHPHRRLNLLTNEWLLVSPHRAKRPWQGQTEKIAIEKLPEYDPACYLCPGNVRANGATNPNYQETFVFDNDFAALLPDTPDGAVDDNDLLIARSERGTARVVCFSPRHDLTFSQMDSQTIRRVIDEWAKQYLELGAQPFVNNVQIFENRGAMMGASNPHPHGQIWASESVPNEVLKEQTQQAKYLTEKGECLLCAYVRLEQAKAERIVFENDDFVALVPFWAVHPFEVMIVGKRHRGSLDELANEERDSLADAIRRLTVRYDNLFDVPFPYSMGFHQKPTDGAAHPEWHFHQHFYPPLLRSATIRKFMVGFELLASPQRDITPEQAAARIREQPETIRAKID